jgi:hypothetical protein
MIAAARFPNDRMRRAYMRMFAWKKRYLVYQNKKRDLLI